MIIIGINRFILVKILSFSFLLNYSGNDYCILSLYMYLCLSITYTHQASTQHLYCVYCMYMYPCLSYTCLGSHIIKLPHRIYPVSTLYGCVILESFSILHAYIHVKCMFGYLYLYICILYTCDIISGFNPVRIYSIRRCTSSWEWSCQTHAYTLWQ